jgi:hypothetical protein
MSEDRNSGREKGKERKGMDELKGHWMVGLEK